MWTFSLFRGPVTKKFTEKKSEYSLISTKILLTHYNTDECHLLLSGSGWWGQQVGKTMKHSKSFKVSLKTSCLDNPALSLKSIILKTAALPPLVDFSICFVATVELQELSVESSGENRTSALWREGHLCECVQAHMNSKQRATITGLNCDFRVLPLLSRWGQKTLQKSAESALRLLKAPKAALYKAEKPLSLVQTDLTWVS